MLAILRFKELIHSGKEGFLLNNTLKNGDFRKNLEREDENGLQRKSKGNNETDS